MTGSVVQINVSGGGIPKRPVALEAEVTPLGITGDVCAHPRFHGGRKQALLLIASEVIEDLRQRGYPVYPGALGENITTRGIDFRQLRIGDQVRIGDVLIELTKVRGPCAALDAYGPSIKQEIYDPKVKAGDQTSEHWGRSGFYAAVLRPGTIRVDDIITLTAALA